MTSAGLGARLLRGERIAEPVALVAAHPDDEALGLGSRLALFDRLTLVHLTDGAPEDPVFARRAGFDSPAAYAAARRVELDAALGLLGCRPVRRLAYSLPDQGVVHRLQDVVARLAEDLAGCVAVFTHAYEGGHPDHDAAALAVTRACERLGAAAPEIWEFAGYFGQDGALQANRFHPDPAAPEFHVLLAPEDRVRKAAAFAAHASQAATLANFPPGEERWRPAPRYDFSRPPPPGAPLYDRYGWALTGSAWRARAAAAFREGPRPPAR